MSAIIRTKSEVVLDFRDNSSEVLYFKRVAEQRSDIGEFKGQIGMYAYTIDVMIMRDSLLVPAYSYYPQVKPIRAVYKLTTWLSLFGEMTPNQISENEADLMIREFVYNSNQYFGLGENDYEIYTPE